MTDSSSTRREFLKGRSAIRAIEAFADTAEPLPAPDSVDTPKNNPEETTASGRQSVYMEHYSKRAMACQFELLFNMHQYPAAGTVAGDIFQLLDDLEDQMTVYRDHSEISRVNERAFSDQVQVEPKLYRLLKHAREIWQSTGGAFDITAGQLSALWGFEQRSGSIPNDDSIKETLRSVGTSHLVFNDDQNGIRFSTEGVKINLGGIGKGFAIDAMASMLRMNGIRDFAIHGGQSSVLCGGDYVADTGEYGAGWPIGLSHPVLPEVRLAHFNLKDRALGTSGSGRQGFFHQGKRYGHIIDPRSGWPTDHFLSTTVISPSAALSDALATAFFVMDLEEIEAYCRKHTDVSAVMITGEPQAGKSAVDLVWFNLTDEDWQRHTDQK